MPQRQLLAWLRPSVRLAPLQQRMHGSASRGPLLPRRRRRPLSRLLPHLPLPNCINFSISWVDKLMQFGGGEAEDALHVEAVGAFLVGGDRGVGERAAGDDRRPALDQRWRSLAQRALGGGLAAHLPQFGR